MLVAPVFEHNNIFKALQILPISCYQKRLKHCHTVKYQTSHCNARKEIFLQLFAALKHFVYFCGEHIKQIEDETRNTDNINGNISHAVYYEYGCVWGACCNETKR